MLPAEIALVFFAASLALAVAPGPDNIFVLTQSAVHGRAVGLVVTLGLCTGLVVHTLAVALGVAALFQASALAFNVLKLVGAGYLLYLAWLAFRASAAHADLGGAPALSLGRYYRRGIIMNVTNPKVSIFFLAFLPQFADPQRGSLTLQIVMLGALFIVATILVFGGVALLAGALGERFNRSVRAQRTMNWLAGTVFAALALKLVSSQR
ncbi:MAG: LysE family translocator [Gammaproteobacteria bacterium]